MGCSSKGSWSLPHPSSCMIFSLQASAVGIFTTLQFYTFLLGYCWPLGSTRSLFLAAPPLSLPQPAGRYTRLLMLIELQQAASCCVPAVSQGWLHFPHNYPPFHLFRLNCYSNRRKKKIFLWALSSLLVNIVGCLFFFFTPGMWIGILWPQFKV